ncbi:hypothetical protein CONCODRAFT_70018 [Conidiobolus coronatus NRRL 28638]|uniref:Uncharacterized protein n=1 Tax=Conidiobolus coronatus (strain ATCC 28846 / CBS 209.66 / NRRL 28638) TaxID=796925 RepID=A0A137P8A2_CONC2|nr:hypothetical protein CONCODRAFT_70018 [Conidiobolus coronatus NRRL 28638]|eukprot:KXN71230.1 hypothetical protein CONCODRAFT_70018 [Conidiobolus coronatus NRRL 28638]
MLKSLVFLTVGIFALDKCSDQQGGAIPAISVDSLASAEKPGDKFCEKFCSKYKGNIFRGTCGIQAGYTACFRIVALDGETEAKPKLCDPVECVECLDYINKGGYCDCGFDCYGNEQGEALDLLHKKFVCSRFHTV